jgi:hypothetical protein
MNRNNSSPIILTLPTYEEGPRTLPFPGRTTNRRRSPAKRLAADDAGLADVRARLLQMIIANEWDRSHGNRAS